jgi:hypothetical protein
MRVFKNYEKKKINRNQENNSEYVARKQTFVSRHPQKQKNQTNSK